MTLDGRYRAVLDRVEVTEDGDDVGVLLIENERGDEVIDERTVERSALPSGVEEGAVLTASFEHDALRHLVFEPAETERRRSELGDRFDRLSQRPPGANGDADDSEGPADADE